MPRSAHAHCCAMLALGTAAALSISEAHAQQLIANGTTESANGSYSTITNNANVLWAYNGGVIDSSGFVTITSSGTNSAGVRAENANAEINLLHGVAINISGNSYGLHASNTADITINGGTVVTSGASAYGAHSTGFSVIALNGVEISAASRTLSAESGGLLMVNGGAVNATGIGSTAAYASGFSALITLENVAVTTAGTNSHGLNSQTTGRIVLNGGTVSTAGSASYGAFADGFTSTITIENGSAISTEGQNGFGLYAHDSAQITMDGGTVRTNGQSAHGAYAGTLSYIELTNGININTTGSSSHGLYADLGSSVIGDSITVSTAGADAAAVVLEIDGSVMVSQSTLTTSGTNADLVRATGIGNAMTTYNSTLSAVDGAGFRIQNGMLLATVIDSTVTGGEELLNVDSTATLNLNAVGSAVTGSAITAAGGASNLYLQATDWTITGDSNVTSLTNGAGSLVHFTPPGSSAGPFKTLTAVNYIGQGGTFGINTVLGADGSPSDMLVIDTGAATGTSLLSVNNVGGAGDLTQLNGIIVVDAINGGSTVPGLFSLAAPVIAGPYEYSLYRGSVDATNPNAWYLRSVLDCALDPSAPICAPDTPNYRSETSLYAAVPAMTLLYGRLMLDTLHERRGTSVSSYAEGAPNAAWARVIGQHGDRDGGKGGIYGAGPKYDYDFWAFQGGMDLYRDGDVGTSRNHAGAFFAIGHGSGDVQHIGSGKAGENSFMAYSWGAYWTHYTPENAYVDALLLGSWYDIDAKSNRIDKLTTNGGAFGASLEGGYPVYTGSGGFSIEPQAQLAYQTVNLNNGSDVAAQVHFDNVNSLVGRIGVRFAQDFGTPTWLTGAPSAFTAWVRPNFWYEFLGDPKTKFSSATGFIPFAADMGGTTFEINTGFSTDIGDGAAIYANASYLVGIGEHADGNAYDGKLGVKVAW